MSEFDEFRASLADRYQILEGIGSGGMAIVFAARDIRHQRDVAIKVLRPELVSSLGKQRFDTEIQIAARLNHPHILTLIDSGEAAGFFYYVMPFVEGQSLRERLEREEQLPIQDTVKLLRHILDALAYAHKHEVVHRDIKPANIMLTGRHALITDFGVAKALTSSVHSQVTSQGVALGTPAYMSPEQAAAAPNIDQRSDIYSVGVLAYELLTGRVPFTGSPQEVLSKHVLDTPEPVDMYRPTTPSALTSMIMKCLQKRPADRWQSADEMLPQLDSLVTPSTGMTPTTARLLMSRRRVGVIIGVVGITMLTVAVVTNILALRGVQNDGGADAAVAATNAGVTDPATLGGATDGDAPPDDATGDGEPGGAVEDQQPAVVDNAGGAPVRTEAGRGGENGGGNVAGGPAPTGASDAGRSTYLSARTLTESARSAAEATGVRQLSAGLIVSADSIWDLATVVANEGRYADATRQMDAARAAYEQTVLVGTAIGRAQVDSLRTDIAALRAAADASTPEYGEAMRHQDDGARQEGAGDFVAAVQSLRLAADAYRKATPMDAASTAPEEVAAPERSPREIVETTLNQLKQAMESENLTAVSSVWVSLTPEQATNYESFFSSASDVRVTYQPDWASLSVADGRIAVDTRTTVDYRDDRRRSRTGESEQHFELAERDGRWVIVGS